MRRRRDVKKIWDALRTPGANYRAMYDERKNALVSVPPVENVRSHLFLTFGYILAVIVITGLLVTAFTAGLQRVMGEGMLTDVIASIPGGIFMMIAIVVYAPRLGLFPGIFGSQVALDSKDALDQKVGTLIKENPSRFNIDWYRDWAESPKAQREDMLKELKSSLAKVKKEQKAQTKKSVS